MQKLIGMDIIEEDKMVQTVCRKTEQRQEGWVDDRLINAICNGSVVWGVNERNKLI